jgi:hypothetical protein
VRIVQGGCALTHAILCPIRGHHHLSLCSSSLDDNKIGKKQETALLKALEVNKRISESLPVPAPPPWVRQWNDAAQRAEYVHPDSAAFPEPQASRAGLIRVDPESELLHGATVALRRFYSRGYPPSAAAYDDHEAVHGVERPNHSLANALRKAALAPAVIAALEANDAGTAPTFDAEELVALQLALVFAVCGRESEASSSDDPEAHARFRRVSCDALVAHVRQRGFAEPVVLAASSALESMYDSGAAAAAVGPTAAAMRRVVRMCHFLDLFRCLRAETMTKKLASTVEPFVGGPPASNRLARRAVAAIRATGDRLLSDAPAGDLPGCTRCDPEVEYDAEAFPRCSLDARECWRAITASAAAAESREGGGGGGGHVSALGRTFATSAFRREYLAAAPPSDYMELLTVVRNALQAHARACGHDKRHADDMHVGLMKEACEHRHELVNETMSVAQRLWTSQALYRNERELCHIINAAIRADGPDDLIAEVAKLSRGINMLLVSTRRGAKPARFPTDGKCYRGGVLPDAHRFFYERVGSQFRVPGFLATSLSRPKAVWFANRASTGCHGGNHKVVWEVRVDPEGKDDDSMLCRNANYVERTNCAGESCLVVLASRAMCVCLCVGVWG